MVRQQENVLLRIKNWLLGPGPLLTRLYELFEEDYTELMNALPVDRTLVKRQVSEEAKCDCLIDELNDRRKAKNMTYKDVAINTGLTYDNVRRILSYQQVPQIRSIIAIANAVGAELVLTDK